jgi:TPR repeat protein
MKTCYVSMPFGKKTDPETGTVVDFDHLYDEVVKPAVEKADFACVRSDDLLPGVVPQKSILAALLQSHAMIADLSTWDPSVFYELGARHALRRGRTLLLLRQGKQLPASISYSRAIVYELGPDGRILEAEEIQRRIVSSLRQTGPMTTDSPFYQFFPDLRVELTGEHATRGPLPKGIPRPPVRKREEVEKTRSAIPLSFTAEEAAEAAPESAESVQSVDPVSFLTRLKGYRDASAWDVLIREAEEAPPDIASSPEIVHLLSLALNRRGHSGDQDRAIDLLEKTVAAIGGGADTLGILGKIYKERYAARGDQHDLERAIRTFRTAFERQATNFYAGVNLVSLLFETVVRRGDKSYREDLDKFLPQVRAVLEEKLKTGTPDFFETSAGLHLACLAHDWDGAELLAELALSAAPSAWMIESTVQELEGVTDLLDTAHQEKLREIIETLRQGVSRTLGAQVPYA